MTEITPGEYRKILKEIQSIKDTLTGTTTDSYADALNWNCEGFNNKTIMLKNTDDANSLDYKVLTYAYPGGVAYEEVSETTLAPGDVAKIVLNYAYGAVSVQVKSTTSGESASYQVDYVGNR